MAMGGADVPTGTLVKWIWPRRSRFRSVHYERARRAARELADPICYVRRGRYSSEPGGLLWRLRTQHDRDTEK
jgi:hypothetical protein